MSRRDLERGRKNVRDALNRSEAPYTSIYLPRTQALALLDAADAQLDTPAMPRSEPTEPENARRSSGQS